jgi:choline dehydrogenase-like flavoprotein
MCIISRPWHGRNGCQNCGYCAGFGCEHQAKSSTLFTVIPMAEATGRCEVRADSYASRVELDDRGRATGVAYFDSNKAEHVQRARAVVLCANGAETPRLLLMSSSTRFPNGLANSSGLVGKNLMFNGNSGTTGVYEHAVNDWKGPMVTRNALDFYNSDPARGFYGGGGLDARFWSYPLLYALQGPPDTPAWGAAYKRRMREDYSRTMNIDVHTTSLPQETNRIELDPALKDAWGLPAIKATYNDHADDLATMKFLHDKALDIHEAAGAIKKWGRPNFNQNGGVHLLGTCRMGNDPATSVVDKYHRTHDVRNLFLADGSSLVTGGRGQPTCTIQALAYRAGEHIAGFARRNEI